MVTNVADVQAVKTLVRQETDRLASRGARYNPHVKLGAMLEVPAAALAVSSLLEVSDFLSVGTNDLIQYLTAADRENSAVQSYQDVEGSGLYQLLEMVMHTAREMGRHNDISVCGELASDPEAACELTRIGFRSLSIIPQAADAVRESLRTVSMQT
jgi:phosphoenolpyruvate-protein kinase (PTS system EI component)